jgi:hypothetical protein
MKTMDSPTAEVRNFILTHFNDDDVLALCYDYFPDVYNNFAHGMEKKRKVHALIEYCRNHGYWDDLLVVLERERPRVFTKLIQPYDNNRDELVSALKRERLSRYLTSTVGLVGGFLLIVLLFFMGDRLGWWDGGGFSDPFAQAGDSPTATLPPLTSTATATSTTTDTPTSILSATITPMDTLVPTSPPPTQLPHTPVPLTSTPTLIPPVPIQTPEPIAELLLFDWNKPVEQSHHGIPWDEPPIANGDWVMPVNFAEGTLHIRAEVRGMPTNKDMVLNFCFWQDGVTYEACTSSEAVSFNGSTAVVTWSTEVDGMWKKDGKPINWMLPRTRNGVTIKNERGMPVTDYFGMNWNGEDPVNWYPMDLRFSVVVVEKDKSFSGWDNYIP